MQTVANAGPFDTTNGLPVHVLVVHVVVVLLPLCGLGAIVIAIIPASSQRLNSTVDSWSGWASKARRIRRSESSRSSEA